MKKIHLHGPLYHLRNRRMILNWTSTKYDTSTKHFVKSVRIRGFSGPHFPAFGLTTEIYRASLRIQSKYRKIQTRKTLGRHFLQSVIQMWHAQLVGYQIGLSPSKNLLHGKLDQNSITISFLLGCFEWTWNILGQLQNEVLCSESIDNALQWPYLRLINLVWPWPMKLKTFYLRKK